MPRFYASDQELPEIHHRLHLTFCPFCKRVGTLILHGWLYGYADTDDGLRICRGRRVLCNSRRKRNSGCGHTFSIWIVVTLWRCRLGALKLWTFLKNVLRLGDKTNALRGLSAGMSISSAYRIWKRFTNRQSYLRTTLAKICPPPLSRSHQPAEQTIAHLQAAFPDAACPIVAFQQQLQIAFL